MVPLNDKILSMRRGKPLSLPPRLVPNATAGNRSGMLQPARSARIADNKRRRSHVVSAHTAPRLFRYV